MMLLIVMVLGLALGSFINAAVWRLHQQAQIKKSKSQYNIPKIFSGRSMCPHCRHQLAAKDLVPLFSWILLRGRCRYCSKSISIQYPLVEALSAILFIWSYLIWPLNGVLSYVSLGFWLASLTGLIILAVYDLRWMILPDRVFKILFPIAIINLAVITVITREFGPLSSHLLAALGAGLFFYALYLFGRGRWLGGGDVKLAVLMGLLLGTTNSLVAFFIGFNLAALYSLALIAARKLNRRDVIPFGPFLIAATIIAMLHGRQLFDFYLNTFLYY